MEILFFCPMWGMADMPLDMMLSKMKNAGYDGIEFGVEVEDIQKRLELMELTTSYGLLTIGQQCFAEGKDFISYKKSFIKNLEWLCTFQPMIINSHTGRDYFSFEQNCMLIEIAEEIAMKQNVKIMHETHRGRFSFAAAQCVPYIERYAALRFTADFSHFCVVSESYLEEQAAMLQTIQERSFHIHARVGHTQGPQVTDPRLPEWQAAVEKHLIWWDSIIEKRLRDNTPHLPITAEFGPQPYLPTVPFTGVPLASQWEINLYMKQLLKSRYTSLNLN